MQSRIALITDSTSDIPHQWVEQYGITVVPLSIIFGEQVFQDGVEMSAEKFYQRLEKDKIHPTTSQPTPAVFRKAYEEAAAAGAEEALVITISSMMSGTIISARQAALNCPIPVTVEDGLNNGMGLGWQVIAAAREREKGGSLQDMINAANEVRKKMVYYVSLDTIDFLSKGGRIADAVSFMNSFLKIKPLVYVKPETGTVSPSIPSRSRRGAIESLYKEFSAHFTRGQRLHVTVPHNGALEEAENLANRIREDFDPVEIFITYASPVLGAHTGPRAVGLIGYSE